MADVNSLTSMLIRLPEELLMCILFLAASPADSLVSDLTHGRVCGTVKVRRRAAPLAATCHRFYRIATPWLYSDLVFNFVIDVRLGDGDDGGIDEWSECLDAWFLAPPPHLGPKPVPAPPLPKPRVQFSPPRVW
jgi:hypothetical protein